MTDHGYEAKKKKNASRLFSSFQPPFEWITYTWEIKTICKQTITWRGNFIQQGCHRDSWQAYFSTTPLLKHLLMSLFTFKCSFCLYSHLKKTNRYWAISVRSTCTRRLKAKILFFCFFFVCTQIIKYKPSSW